MRTLCCFAALFAASFVNAGPLITSVTPSSGPTSGGTTVTIMGSGFSNECPPNQPDCIPQPPRVLFGDRIAASTTLVNSSTIVATTPPHLPGTAQVKVEQLTGVDAEPAAFTFTGPVLTNVFERVLLPLYTRDAAGAFGSVFRTSLTLGSMTGMSELFGLEISCPHPPCVPTSDQRRIALGPGSTIRPHQFIPNGTPGRFIYVTRASDHLAGHVRVRDITRETHNIGTEVPLVRESEFRSDHITLMNDPETRFTQYRSTLRIYSHVPAVVEVTIDFNRPIDVELRGGANIFDPYYGVFAAFPFGPWTSITLRVATPPIGTPSPTPIWAFASITNNETQMITTVTPQP
jgi:hypothetical protein